MSMIIQLEFLERMLRDRGGHAYCSEMGGGARVFDPSFL